MQKKSMPQKIKDRLFAASANGISNQKYQKAINVYEKYYEQYRFEIGQKYRMAMLYDHRAMQIGEKVRRIFNHYLKKAEGLYRDILKENPSYFHAIYGIGRVYSVRGDYKVALKLQIKAYNMMLTLPRKERGALAIGYLYERLEDYKNAEKWYLREHRDAPKDDFGTILNLFQFYRKRGNIKKALHYAPMLERLVKSEYKKKIYKGMNMSRSGFVKEIKNNIREVKRGRLK